MYCGICKKEKKENELHKFYWGFWSWEYDPKKWTLACDDCLKDFRDFSAIAYKNRDPLILMERKIKTKVRKR